MRNVEIKARCDQPDTIREILQDQNADFKGTDHQIDTYFQVDEGRLKLRQGTIENSLIYYRRPDTPSPKLSDIDLVRMDESNSAKMKSLLTNALGIVVVVDKEREIYFIENVKFHIDNVQSLGSFVEIEAINEDGSIGKEKLRSQCEFYMDLLGIEEEDLVANSYSDMRLKQSR